MLTCVEQVNKETTENEAESAPFDKHCCDSDDEVQQDRGGD